MTSAGCLSVFDLSGGVLCLQHLLFSPSPTSARLEFRHSIERAPFRPASRTHRVPGSPLRRWRWSGAAAMSVQRPPPCSAVAGSCYLPVVWQVLSRPDRSMNQ